MGPIYLNHDLPLCSFSFILDVFLISIIKLDIPQKFPFHKIHHIGIGRYEKTYRFRYRYRPIREMDLSVIIGIGRYEKRLIGRTLNLCPYIFYGKEEYKTSINSVSIRFFILIGKATNNFQRAQLLCSTGVLLHIYFFRSSKLFTALYYYFLDDYRQRLKVHIFSRNFYVLSVMVRISSKVTKWAANRLIKGPMTSIFFC